MIIIFEERDIQKDKREKPFATLTDLDMEEDRRHAAAYADTVYVTKGGVSRMIKARLQPLDPFYSIVRIERPITEAEFQPGVSVHQCNRSEGSESSRPIVIVAFGEEHAKQLASMFPDSVVADLLHQTNVKT